jgi:CheY-like chemotaxis protein
VETTADGSTALTRVQAGGVDLVLLDLRLPDAEILKLCRQFRAVEGDIHLPIIVLARPMSEAQRRAAFIGEADDYVVKPINAPDLLDRVQLWMWIHERLKGTRPQTVHGREQLLQLGKHSLREQLAQDAAVIAMARTASDQLRQPLTALLGWLELWKDTGFAEEPPEYWYGKFRAAADGLSARIDALSRVVRYEPKEVDGQVQIDIVSAQWTKN